jgi:hypothetical protein
MNDNRKPYRHLFSTKFTICKTKSHKSRVIILCWPKGRGHLVLNPGAALPANILKINNSGLKFTILLFNLVLVCINLNLWIAWDKITKAIQIPCRGEKRQASDRGYCQACQEMRKKEINKHYLKIRFFNCNKDKIKLLKKVTKKSLK